MTAEEALKILNVKEEADTDQIMKVLNTEIS